MSKLASTNILRLPSCFVNLKVTEECNLFSQCLRNPLKSFRPRIEQCIHTKISSNIIFDIHVDWKRRKIQDRGQVNPFSELISELNELYDLKLICEDWNFCNALNIQHSKWKSNWDNFAENTSEALSPMSFEQTLMAPLWVYQRCCRPNAQRPPNSARRRQISNSDEQSTCRLAQLVYVADMEGF